MGRRHSNDVLPIRAIDQWLVSLSCQIWWANSCFTQPPPPHMVEPGFMTCTSQGALSSLFGPCRVIHLIWYSLHFVHIGKNLKCHQLVVTTALLHLCSYIVTCLGSVKDHGPISVSNLSWQTHCKNLFATALLFNVTMKIENLCPCTWINTFYDYWGHESGLKESNESPVLRVCLYFSFLCLVPHETAISQTAQSLIRYWTETVMGWERNLNTFSYWLRKIWVKQTFHCLHHWSLQITISSILSKPVY